MSAPRLRRRHSATFPQACLSPGGLLIDSRSTPVQYERTARHIARSGIDHYQLAMYLDGETEFTAGRRSAHLRAGDVCLIDMAQANSTRMKAGASGVSRVLTLVVPRAGLAPLLAVPGFYVGLCDRRRYAGGPSARPAPSGAASGRGARRQPHRGR